MPYTIKHFKDKKKALRYRNHQRKNNYAKTRIFGINKYVRWSEEHIKIIMEHKINDRQIAKIIGRSVVAICQKRNEIKYKHKEAHPCAERPPQDTAEAGSTCV